LKGIPNAGVHFFFFFFCFFWGGVSFQISMAGFFRTGFFLLVESPAPLHAIFFTLWFGNRAAFRIFSAVRFSLGPTSGPAVLRSWSGTFFSGRLGSLRFDGSFAFFFFHSILRTRPYGRKEFFRFPPPVRSPLYRPVPRGCG